MEREKHYLKKTLLPDFLETLRQFGELHAPTVSESGVTSFAPLKSRHQLRLDYVRTLIPPKKYLLRFKDDILLYRDGVYRQPDPPPGDTVLFGVHPCDLDGIGYLDRVFLAERPDPRYRQRRERLLLIGISCAPDDFCFCSGSGGEAPCDLFLDEAGAFFAVSVCSDRGKAIAAAAQRLLVEPQPGPESAPLPTPIPPQDPELRFSDNPLWDKFAERCVSCGACSVCCPTCYCFDVREYPTLDGGGRRIREWDNCLFISHGEVAGANFRPRRLDRLRYRFLHKYCGFSPLQGMTSCVGCGRCRSACPVDIDLRELIETGRRPEAAKP